MHLAPLIRVHHVEAISAWYQQLLGLRSGHGGAEYEGLNAGDRRVLQLHQWAVDHHRGPLGDPTHRPHGNGALLWSELPNFEAAVARAQGMGVVVLRPSQLSENANWEFWLREPDGCTVVLTSPLVS